MRYQSKKSGCGPNALFNALQLLGVKRSEDELATLCGTDIKGTDTDGLVAALDNIGIKHGEIRLIHTLSDAASSVLHHRLCNGSPVLACVDKWDHWVTVAGFLGSRFLVLDGASVEGTLIYSESDFATRWCHPRFGFYGISLER